MLYRIFTEHKNLPAIKCIVADWFDGCTMFEAVGYWQGKREKSLCIEIWGHEDWWAIKAIVSAIKRVNSQDAVLVQQIECIGQMI